MKLIRYLILTTFIAIIIGCSASQPPKELQDARMAYQKASNGDALKLVPAELHKAEVALATAEKAFIEDPDSYTARDLAYIADRKAKMAEGLAKSALEKAATEKANKDYEKAQSEILQSAKADLVESERIANEKDKQLTDALTKLAAKEDERGLVIILSGSILFASDKATLLPAAQNKLNEVAQALLESKERRITIEGHTDSQGSIEYNNVLAQKRADAVRSYIISLGYPSNLIYAKGVGEERPIANNNSPEGRANNRRVEIIIDRK
jgi:outer membrane protein OmpA-like peptidoglycan-associated protein